MKSPVSTKYARDVIIACQGVKLSGDLVLSEASHALVVFAHGSGSSRHSPRNKSVARFLQGKGLGTLLFDLLTQEEEQAEYCTRHLRFDIHMLAERLIAATNWIDTQSELRGLSIGYFGSST